MVVIFNYSYICLIKLKETIMIFICILTLLNSVGLIYIYSKSPKGFYVTLRKEETIFVNTLLGYRLTLWKRTGYGASGIYSFYLPRRNREKTELREEVERLKNDKYNQEYTLRAKFSWLRTYKEVSNFAKKYGDVNPAFVDNLIANFEPRPIKE